MTSTMVAFIVGVAVGVLITARVIVMFDPW